MAENKSLNVTKANFGAKGWAVCIYMFFIFFLNTSMNTGWQNCLSYYETTYGWDTTTLLSLVSVAQFIGIAACFITASWPRSTPPGCSPSSGAWWSPPAASASIWSTTSSCLPFWRWWPLWDRWSGPTP